MSNCICRIFRMLILMLLWLLWPLWAGAQQLPLRYHTQQDGLANLTVTALELDRAGYMWAGTENGLFRYNGGSFLRYGKEQGLAEAFIVSVLDDGEDRLWVGDHHNVYLRIGERFVAVLHGDRPLPLSSGRALVAAPDGDRLAISGRRLYRLEPHGGQPRAEPVFSEEALRRQPLLGRIDSVLADARDQMWLGCGQGLCQYSHGELSVWGPEQGVPDEQWRTIVRDGEGRLWARGDQHTIVLPAAAARFIDRTPPGGVQRKVFPAKALALDPQGRILSGADRGVLRWSDERWQVFDSGNGLNTAGGVNALLFDRDGNLWIGSRGRGLIAWEGYGNWENWTSAEGLPDNVALSFVRDRAGVLHAGTRAGSARMLPGAGRFTPALSHSDHQWGSQVLDRQGRLWASTYSGLLMRDDGDGRGARQVAQMPLLRHLFVDRQGRLWMSTRKGLFVLDTDVPDVAAPGAAAAMPVPRAAGPSGTQNASFHGICQDPGGALWFAADQQVLRLAGAQWEVYPLGAVGEGQDMNGLACDRDGAIWLGNDAGLWRATAAGGVLRHEQQNVLLLRGKVIYYLKADSRGWLWAATDAGVAVWNRKHWRLVDQSNGLVWNDTNGEGIYEDQDGSVWIATSNGISHLLQPQRLFAPGALPVLIENATRRGQPLAAGPAWSLPWSSEPLELSLASPGFQDRAGVRFHYRMAGLETSWSVSAAPAIRYAALPAGDYKLEYFASNERTGATSSLARQSLRILPPWWQTEVFYLLCAVLTVLALTALYHYRLRKLTAHQRWMEQLVLERTRELELSREELRARALRDGLTKVWNRNAMLEIIDRELDLARQQGTPLLLILLDLDHFKRINDTHGHAAGDTVLQEVVLRLCAAVRQSDSVGRYGGEEFLILLPGLDQHSGHARVQQLHGAISGQPFQLDEGLAIGVTGSFGVIAFEPQRPLTSPQLIARADQALYRCKEHGRNCIEYADQHAA